MRVAPDVTVLICAYNAAHTLGESLRSLDGQTFPRERFEVIVVDDGSTDGTEDVVRPFAVRYLRNPVNRGLSASCNRGLEAAGGEYFIRLDADDTFEPGILAAMVPWLDSDATDLVSCDRYERDARTGHRRHVAIRDFNLYQLIAIGVMMRRELLRAIGGYSDLFWEEYDLFLRYLTKSGRPPHHLQLPLLTYTLHADSMTADEGRVREGWRQFLTRWPPEEAARFGPLPRPALEALQS